MMNAVRFHEHGAAEVLRYETAPDPHLQPDQVLLEVRAASVNHLDIFVRQGLPGAKLALPHIPGADAAGIVREVGRRVTAIQAGQRVVINPGFGCGACGACTGGQASLCRQYRIFGEHIPGSYAEQMAVPARNIHPIDEQLTFEDAAAAGLVFLTAWSMLITKGRLRPGEDVLVLGAAAGVGTAAIQIARLAGCRVWAAAGSDAKLERARELGAQELINYNTEEFDRVVRERTGKRGVDVVVDYVGADTWPKSLRAVRSGGRVLTCGATTGPHPETDLRHIFYRQLQVIGSTMGSPREFEEVMGLINGGVLKPVVDRILPLSAAGEAHRAIERREVSGKIVLQP
jgi:NADPH:quinone reductase-like Zn-dependent oxidoreductase